MSEAFFAIAGALVGVLGAMAIELVRASSENNRHRREALRAACADLTVAIAGMKTVAFHLRDDPKNAGVQQQFEDAHMSARAAYERLRLTAASHTAQEAGRRALRHAYGLRLVAQGQALRPDEVARGPSLLLQDALMSLYAEVRRELGVPRPGDVFREPDDWLGFSHAPDPGPDAPSE
jgi:hypothetical protein